MGWVEGIGGELRLPFRHNGTSCVPKELPRGPQTTLQSKAGRLVTVMGDWEQLQTNVTKLKPTKHCHSLLDFYRVMKMPCGKADLLICSYFVVVSI